MTLRGLLTTAAQAFSRTPTQIEPQPLDPNGQTRFEAAQRRVAKRRAARKAGIA